MNVDMKAKTGEPRKEPNPAALMTAGELFAKVMDSEASHTSFGKLVMGDEKSAPLFCTFTYSQHDNSVRNGRAI